MLQLTLRRLVNRWGNSTSTKHYPAQDDRDAIEDYT